MSNKASDHWKLFQQLFKQILDTGILLSENIHNDEESNS